jgi:hypothetical protein
LSPVRIAGALILLVLAFFSLEKSVPRVVFLHHGSAFWSAEGLFEISEAPRTLRVTVGEKNLHRSLRARFSTCPKELPSCEAGVFRAIPLPSSGELSLTFPEGGAPVSMEFFREPFHPLFLVFLVLLLAAAFLAFQNPLVRALETALILTAGPYFAVSMGRWRGMDVGGHLDHVARIAKDATFFVNARACWECHQPPPYYALASSALLWPKEILPSDAVLLQGLALLFHCLSVPFIVASLKHFAASRRALILYSALVCLWPAAVFQSVRLGNDGALNLLAFACLFFLLRRHFIAACLVASSGYLVKNSGVVLLGLTSSYLTWEFLRAPERRLSRMSYLFCGLALLAAPLLNSGLNHLKNFDEQRFAQMAPPLKTSDSPAELLLPDLTAFVRDPFLNPWIPSPNRDHTPNYFWKTSLTGEWSFGFPGAADIARALSFCLLLLLGTAFWQATAGKGLRSLPVLSIGLSLSAVAVYRYAHHFANNADFRFVYPAAALGVALLLTQARGFMGRLSFWLTASFLGLAQVFFALLWIYESR